MNSPFSHCIHAVFLSLLIGAVSVSFGQQTPAPPSADDLGALLGGLLNGGQGAPSPQELERLKAMRDAFLQDAAAQQAAVAAAAKAAATADTAKAADQKIAGAKGESALPAVPPPAAPDLGALFGGIIQQLNIEATPDGNVKINGQEIDPQTALLDMQKNGGLKPGETPKFLQGVIKPEQLDAIRKQAEAVQPNPDQLKQLELIAQRLQQTLRAQALPAAPAPKPAPLKPFVP